ncbi:MAG: hypothetical protein JOZ17_00020 [Acetobacteraceae bacterium]|nr:hypothetical protein [Acetobacteraceae bacterium]
MSEAALYSLNEAAELTGLSVDALRQRIKRRKIHAVRGNDGLVRVRLDEADTEALRTGRPPSRPPSQLAEQSSPIIALQDHITTLREQLIAANTRTNEMLADLRAERRASSERSAADAEERRRLGARITELEAEVIAMRAKVARTLWARLRDRLRPR